MKKVINALIHPANLYQYCSRRGWLKWMSDEKYIKKIFKLKMGYDLNLSHPKTFNEKLQWLKMNNRDNQYTTLVDKCAVRGYIETTIGGKYLIPILGIWDSFGEIDFEKLPDRFVLKCTHDSASVVICRDKAHLDKSAVCKKLSRCLSCNGYNFGREWPYKNVTPRIIAEQYMEDEENKGDLSDYKIHCFNGEPKVIQVITDRFSSDGMINDHYDLSWNKLDIVRGHYSSGNKVVLRPAEMDEMLELAKKLSAGIPYLRTDFYIVNHQIYFGELTFFPASGFRPFIPEKWDRIWGDWIKLPTDNATK